MPRWLASYWATWWNADSNFITPRLYVLDGGKALTTAVKSTPVSRGDPALPGSQAAERAGSSDDEQKPRVAKKPERAYALEDYDAASRR